MGRGHQRDHGNIYPNIMVAGRIVGLVDTRIKRVDYRDKELVLNRFAPGSVIGVCQDSEAEWCSEVDSERYDLTDLNNVLWWSGQIVPTNMRAVTTIKGLCDSPSFLEYMENEFNIDSDLICDNSHDCPISDTIDPNENVNIELLCPNGPGRPSEVFNPLKVLCETGISCNYPVRCISNGSVPQEVCDIYSSDKELCIQNGCSYKPAMGNEEDQPTYHFPCIVYAENCKNDDGAGGCNDLMVQISDEVSETGDITQRLFRQCRQNPNCRDMMDCTLTNIDTNPWSIRGQCSPQEDCDEGYSSISWPCLTIENENYYKCKKVTTPRIFDNSNCYCAGVTDYQGMGMGYEGIRGISENDIVRLQTYLNIDYADVENTVRTLLLFDNKIAWGDLPIDRKNEIVYTFKLIYKAQGGVYAFAELGDDIWHTSENSQTDVIDLVIQKSQEQISTIQTDEDVVTIEYNTMNQIMEDAAEIEYNNKLELLRQIQIPICESNDRYGNPFCYTNIGDCIDGGQSGMLPGYETSYEACNSLSLNKINKDNRYIDNNWDNFTESGGFWNHYELDNYGYVKKCNNNEINNKYGCEPCKEQTGCMVSDEQGRCLHLGYHIFAKECEIGYPYINTDPVIQDIFTGTDTVISPASTETESQPASVP